MTTKRILGWIQYFVSDISMNRFHVCLITSHQIVTFRITLYASILHSKVYSSLFFIINNNSNNSVHKLTNFIIFRSLQHLHKKVYLQSSSENWWFCSWHFDNVHGCWTLLRASLMTTTMIWLHLSLSQLFEHLAGWVTDSCHHGHSVSLFIHSTKVCWWWERMVTMLYSSD